MKREKSRILFISSIYSDEMKIFVDEKMLCFFRMKINTKPTTKKILFSMKKIMKNIMNEKSPLLCEIYYILVLFNLKKPGKKDRIQASKGLKRCRVQ